MAALYELYFEDQSGDIIFCDDYENEQDVINNYLLSFHNSIITMKLWSMYNELD